MMAEHNFLPPNPNFLHYLWALAFMRLYPTNDAALSAMFGGEGPQDNKQICLAVHPITFWIDQSCGKKIMIVVFILLFIRLQLNFRFEPQIKFENRKEGDVGRDCLLSVDGTDFRIAMGYCKVFWSYKFKKSGLRYEVGLCIKTGNICWWSGPYAPGKWNDLAIFRDSLVSMLEPGERCETDRGYQGAAPAYVKCPGVVEADPNTAEIQQRVRSRQETVNKQFKNWAILSTVYRHDFLEHQTVFGAIVVLTQLSFVANPLFQVAY